MNGLTEVTPVELEATSGGIYTPQLGSCDIDDQQRVESEQVDIGADELLRMEV